MCTIHSYAPPAWWLLLAAVLPGVAAHRSLDQEALAAAEGIGAQTALASPSEGAETKMPGVAKWVAFYCTHHNIGKAALNLVEEDEDFDENCKALFHEGLSYCIRVALQKDDKPKDAQAWQSRRDNEKGCEQFSQESKIARRAVAIDTNVATAVSGCESQLVGVCVTHCMNKEKANLEMTTTEDCLKKCSVLTTFHTGTIEACTTTWEQCLEDHNERLTNSNRDPDLEAIMREMTVKCVCVNLPNAHARCYSQYGLGLREDQKWCEWDDTPSWRAVKAKWAKNWPNEEMAVPECV